MGDGKNLKKLLNTFGLSVKELADKMEVAPTTLYSIINRDSGITVGMLDKIARTLDKNWRVIYGYFGDFHFSMMKDVDGLLESEGYEKLYDNDEIYDNLRQYADEQKKTSVVMLRGHGKIYEIDFDDYTAFHNKISEFFHEELEDLLKKAISVDDYTKVEK